MKVVGIFYLLSLFFEAVLLAEDYYELLGVSKDAGNREIRQAFKKLALKLHPDKNKEEGANEKFLKINRAYEVLKDEKQRKKYDIHGDDMDGQKQRHYESWNYYHEDFGIYDDDPEIVTLDGAEFKRSVLESHDIWFVNFYSPRCGHCHDLAPTWRSVARQLEGVVRIGAVNCQDDFMLCRTQGITGYPSLYLFTYESRKKFNGPKEEESLISFILGHLPDKVIELWDGNFESWASVQESRNEPWLIIFCDEEFDCPDGNTQQLIGNVLNGLVTFGMVHCYSDPSVCQELRREGEEGSVIFFPDGLITEKGKHLKVSVYDHKEISVMVLLLLPEAIKLDQVAFAEMKKRLKKEIRPPWLVQFVHGNNGDDMTFKKLSGLLQKIVEYGQVDCKTDRHICSDLYITKFPSFVIFKLGGGYEVYYGRNTVDDVAAFARVSSQARTMQTLTTKDFPNILTIGDPVVVDFFAPWCPPCMNLLPEFRKASSIIGGSIQFGTVDCTIHQNVCNQHNINAYPTTIFYNSSQPHRYSGVHDATELSDFVMDILRPTDAIVITLTKYSFNERVGSKNKEEMWLVDFYAPWCGPCQQLAPQWRSLAKMLKNIPFVHIGQVDCTQEADICFNQGVQSYPTIRMYPMNSKGLSKYIPYNQYNRNAHSLRQWVHNNLPSSVENITPFSFKHSVLGSNRPWLVEFYAPLCGHCVQFAPEYEQVAVNLRGRAKVGKVNCEKYTGLCSKMGISAYPTIRFYRGSQEGEDYHSEEVKSRDPENIVSYVEQKIQNSPSTSSENHKHDEL